MSRNAQTEKPNILGGIGALLGIVGLFGGMFAFRWLAGKGTSAFLDATGRLDVDSYYDGRTQEHLIGIGSYWALALMYAAPVLVTSFAVNPWRPSPGVLARAGTYTLLGFTVLYTVGVMSFAFDPSRSGSHEPLIDRYEEFSYEASDLVMAATWTMLVTGFFAFAGSMSQSRRMNIVLPVVAFLGSAALFAAAFT